MTPTGSAHNPIPLHRLAALLVTVVATLISPQATAQDAAQPIFIIRTWTGERYESTALDPSIAALSFQTADSTRTLPWRSVRSIEGDLTDNTRALLTMGRNIWRATTRLDRGDSFGAEPLFETAFERTRGAIGPTPAAVAEGLLRCRLRRDARAAAIDAWLELAANLAAAPAADPNWGLRLTAIDRRTRLVPSLPPVWYDSLPARAFADALVLSPPAGNQAESASPDARPGDPADAIRTLYRAAARHALGDPIDAGAVARAADAASAREGGRLVAQAVLAQIGGAEARAAAREALARELDTREDRWRAVWASLALGRSLLREPDPADQRRGILTLLAIHATDADAVPYLTGIALADAALAAERLGDLDAADTIRVDLASEYPDHPVRRLPGLAQRSHTEDTPTRSQRAPGAS